MQHAELRERVLEANLALGRAGLVVLTFGNASAVDRDASVIAIKPSGVSYDRLTPAAISVVDLESGAVVDGRTRPSSDTPTHLVLYRAWLDVGGRTARSRTCRGTVPSTVRRAACGTAGGTAAARRSCRVRRVPASTAAISAVGPDRDALVRAIVHRHDDAIRRQRPLLPPPRPCRPPTASSATSGPPIRPPAAASGPWSRRARARVSSVDRMPAASSAASSPALCPATAATGSAGSAAPRSARGRRRARRRSTGRACEVPPRLRRGSRASGRRRMQRLAKRVVGPAAARRVHRTRRTSPRPPGRRRTGPRACRGTERLRRGREARACLAGERLARSSRCRPIADLPALRDRRGGRRRGGAWRPDRRAEPGDDRDCAHQPGSVKLGGKRRRRDRRARTRDGRSTKCRQREDALAEVGAVVAPEDEHFGIPPGRGRCGRPRGMVQ